MVIAYTSSLLKLAKKPEWTTAQLLCNCLLKSELTDDDDDDDEEGVEEALLEQRL